jgi:hypothetical protein
LILVAICLCFVVVDSAQAQSQPPVPAAGKGPAVTAHATGSFDVTLKPQGTPDNAEGIALGGMSIAKQFHGDLDGTSTGAMLTAVSDSNGSAAYVAIERVTGTLHGRRGTFVLMHRGTMTRDGQQLTVTVAPGSGTDQLTGLGGSMAIQIVEKRHLYDFEYTLAPIP